MELCQYDLSVYIGVDGLRLMRALQSADPSDVLNQLSRVLTIMGQITEGVAHIHSKDAVHRDIKPHNGMKPMNCH
jgi:serine/threonine protein kinase